MDIQALVLHFLQTQPLFLTIVAVIGSVRLFMKPIFTIARMILARLPAPEDEAAQEAAYASQGWYKAMAWILDLLFSVKLPAASSASNSAPASDPKSEQK